MTNTPSFAEETQQSLVGKYIIVSVFSVSYFLFSTHSMVWMYLSFCLVLAMGLGFIHPRRIQDVLRSYIETLRRSIWFGKVRMLNTYKIIEFSQLLSELQLQVSIHHAWELYVRHSSQREMTFLIGILLANSASNCQQVVNILTWFEALSVISNSFLFLLRLLAVHADGSKLMKLCFVIMWTTTFLSITSTISIKEDGFIGCNVDHVNPIGSLGFIFSAMFDILVFVAISVKVLRINTNLESPQKSWLSLFITAEGLSQVSRILLRSGQIYYLYVLFEQNMVH